MTTIEAIFEDLKSFAPEEIEAIARNIHERAKARRVQNIELFEETENQIAIERDREMDSGVDEGISIEDSMKLARKSLDEGRIK